MSDDQFEVRRAIEQYLGGSASLEELIAQLAASRTSWFDGLSVDIDRNRRCGLPEAIFGQGKTLGHLQAAVASLQSAGQDVLITRLEDYLAKPLSAQYPEAIYHSVARTWRLMQPREQAVPGRVAVVTAGSTDLPVALEAIETLAWMRVDQLAIDDVGVAGPYRLLAKAPLLRDVSAVVVVAGMEGALPSVVAGHVRCPVIAVPTSVGYGANFAGLSALLSMLNSCAPHVAVVNIDSGFKGAYLAGMIARGKSTTAKQAD